MRTLLLGFAVAMAAWAGPVYRITFSGTMVTGTISALTNQNTFYQADLAGTPISGYMDFDFGLAPLPTVTFNGVTTTAIDGSGGPQFITQHVELGLNLPADVLPLPTFDMTRALPPPDGVYNQPPTNNQVLAFELVNTGTVVFPQENYQDSWLSPTTNQTRNIILAMLISQDPGFFPSQPGIPDHWSVTNSSLNGFFGVTEFLQDRTQANDPVLHGVLRDYSLSGQFSIESASGGFVEAPEPGSVGLAAVGILFVAARMGRRKRGTCEIRGTPRRVTSGLRY